MKTDNALTITGTAAASGYSVALIYRKLNAGELDGAWHDGAHWRIPSETAERLKEQREARLAHEAERRRQIEALYARNTAISAAVRESMAGAVRSGQD